MSRIYTFNELKESKLIYDRKPPAFGIIITLLTLIFVIAAIFWAAFSTKTYVVKANGLIASENKVNIMNRVSAPIKEICVIEGQNVNVGDSLIIFDSFQTELQIGQIQSMAEFFQGKVTVIESLISFINNFTLIEPDTQINPFDKNISDESKAYSDAQTFIDYIDGQKKSAANEDPPKEYLQSDVDNLKSQFLSQQYTSLDEFKAQLTQQSSQLIMYQNSLYEYTLKAEQTGIVHLTMGITVGTLLQAGTLLGNISSSDNTTYYFEAVLNATDRSKVNIDDKVEIAIGGAMQSEFGVLKGKVAAIDNDSTQTEKGEVFYRIKIKPNTAQLKNRRGDIINLTTGMIGESRIKYDETTWLKWAIEQIGIKFR